MKLDPIRTKTIPQKNTWQKTWSHRRLIVLWISLKKQSSFTPPILTSQPQKYVPAVISIVDKWHGDCPGGKEGGKIVLNRSRNYWKLISGQRTRTNIHWEGKLKTDPVVQRCLTFVWRLRGLLVVSMILKLILYIRYVKHKRSPIVYY